VSFKFEALEKRHNRSSFSCGDSALDRYFHTQVTQDVRRYITSCFVAISENTIAGFYTLSSASIPVIDLPKDITKRLPRYPVLPAIKIGRLAVDLNFQGQGLGSILLFDSMQRAVRSETAGFTLLVNAKNQRAVSFYKHHGFEILESDPKTLFLPLATAKKLI